MVHAQDDARALNHDYVGTEHILLGLLRQTDTLPARALGSLGISTELVRAHVVRLIGGGEERTTGQISYTPRAMRTLELASREASTLDHHYVGTEHLLLGLARLGEGSAARILAGFDAPPRKIAGTLMALMGSTEASEEYVEGFAPTIAPGEPETDL